MIRQELVQRRIKQADNDRQAFHCPQDAVEVVMLEEQELRYFALFFFTTRFSEDHRLNNRQTIFLEKHVLGAAQANTACTIFTGAASVGGVIRVGVDVQLTELIGPTQQLLQHKFLREIWLDAFDLAFKD